MGAVVVEPGSSTLVLGQAQVLDRASMHLANALLGNPDSAAGLEVLLGGLKLRFVTGSAVAVTGAEGMVTLNGKEFPLNRAVRVPPGAVLEFGPALFGLRYYVGVQGGISAQGQASARRGATRWCGSDVRAAAWPWFPRSELPRPACCGSGTPRGGQGFARASGPEFRRRYVASIDQ